MWKFAIVLFLIGAALTGYSLTLDAYENEAHYWQQLARIAYFDDAAFASLRADSLTARYQLQDYGITLMAVGAIAFLATRNGKDSVKSPGSSAVLVLVAVAVPAFTIAGIGFDIMQPYNRGEYPPWGDAALIGLISLPILFLPLLFWSLFHLGIFWPYGKQHSAPLGLAFSRQANWWLLVVSAITIGLMIYFAVLGYWWL
ncbi:MAG: hypothetical protein R6X18_19250, partial [Chloroflexota bacterium]